MGLLAAGVVVASQVLDSGDTAAAPPPTRTTPPPRTGPIGLVPVDAPAASAPECAALLAALPAELTSGSVTLSELPIAAPAPAGVTAWGDRVGDPVVLRCGLAKPPELTPTSALRQVSGVRWLPVPGTASASWFAVDRTVYIALTLPEGVGTGPLQTVSEVVGATLPAQRVTP
ncbi:DUF3515 domain-containing protein [Actinokineospora sp.]|uniref:DUF3515 domain-containing protein n=1 Tax=Actinokineospora sp. TaxID=1872133 RepID=UPI004037FD8E